MKPDAAALRSPDPAEVEAELSCLDGRFRYRVTATLKDQAPLGELMLDRARTKPVAMEQAGKPLEDPNAQVVYDVTVVLRIEKVYADGYALMHGPFVVISREEGYSGPGKVPLIEYKLGEAYNRAASPARDAGAGSFPSKDRGKIIPGHLILITVSPLGATGPGKGTPGI